MNAVKEKTENDGFPLPRSARLLKHAQFEAVYGAGKRHFSGVLTAFYLVTAGSSSGSSVRVGLTVGRAFGGAVVRNRIKRRLRDAFRHALPQLASAMQQKGLSAEIVINPKKSLLATETSALRAEVDRAFRAIASARPQVLSPPNKAAAPARTLHSDTRARGLRKK